MVTCKAEHSLDPSKDSKGNQENQNQNQDDNTNDRSTCRCWNEKKKKKLKHRWRDLIFLSNVMLCVSASKCHHAISEKSVKQVWFQNTKISRRFCWLNLESENVTSQKRLRRNIDYYWYTSWHSGFGCLILSIL